MVLSCSPVCSPKVRGERRGGPGCWLGAACAARRGRELGSAELGDAAVLVSPCWHCLWPGLAFYFGWGGWGGASLPCSLKSGLEIMAPRSSCTKFPSRLGFVFLAAPLLLVLKAGSRGSPALSLALCSALSWPCLLPCMRSPCPLGGQEGLKGCTEPLHIPPCLQLGLLSLCF